MLVAAVGVAAYAIPAGFARPPLFVVAIVRAPTVVGVYVNVFASLVADHVRLAGLNVPPSPPSEGVIVPVNTPPTGTTVKSVEDTFTVPEDGPVSVYVVAVAAAAPTVNVFAPGFATAGEALLERVIEYVPSAGGVYASTFGSFRPFQVSVVGANAPPAPPTEGVTVAGYDAMSGRLRLSNMGRPVSGLRACPTTSTGPFGVTVNVAGSPTLAVLGPVIVRAVALAAAVMAAGDDSKPEWSTLTSRPGSFGCQRDATSMLA
jgi:hypothetical protein